MDWNIEGTSLIKEFEFANFRDAVTFVNNILPLAEEANHHPDLLIHSYRKVKVMLTTHEKNAVTGKDRALATRIDALTRPSPVVTS